MLTISRLLSLLFICLMFNACGSDVDALQDEKLIGNWELAKATRDGIETETLSGLFLHFNDTLVETNIRGAGTEELPYSIDGSNVIINQSEDMQLDIVSIDKDSLIIQLDIKEIDFRLWFYKM